MPRANLFDLARSNGPNVKRRFEAAHALAGATVEAQQQRELLELVDRDGRVALNLRPWVLNRLLAGSSHQSIHEWANEQASISGRAAAEIAKERLGRYCERRMAFESSFEGAPFRYGTLNAGGVGPTDYGQFCAILATGFPLRCGDVAYLAADSLNDYVLPSNAVQTTRIAEDLADHPHRAYLATLKHMDAVTKFPPGLWPQLLCSSAGYVETIFRSAATAGDIEEIRISAPDWEYYFNLAFADYSKHRSKPEAALAADFAEILIAAKTAGIRITRC